MTRLRHHQASAASGCTEAEDEKMTRRWSAASIGTPDGTEAKVRLRLLHDLVLAHSTTRQLMQVRTIPIKQEDWGRALALRSHLMVLFETVLTESEGNMTFRHPLTLDPGRVLLTAASLRAMLFDDTGEPLLLSFLKRYNLDLTINSFDGDFAMLFYSQTNPAEDGHLTDFLFQFLLAENEQKVFPEGELKEFLFGAQGQVSASLKTRFDVWAPKDKWAQHSAIGPANEDYMVQLCHITRRYTPAHEWGALPLGRLKDISIRRQRVVEYAANYLGGVHYDSDHHTNDPTKQNEFRMLSQAFDWEHQSGMHGILVALAICAIEIASAPSLFALFRALLTGESNRRDRILAGERLK